MASPAEQQADRARGALLGTFVGDALGMPYEGAAPERVPERPGMEDGRLGRGSYTDDTQMMIALAEVLLEDGTCEPDRLGRAFVGAFDPARGYGSGTRQVLALVESGVPASEAALRLYGGEGSRGNGAAMRVAPVAVRFAGDLRRVIAEADRSARATHGHLFAIDAARVQAAAVTAALRGTDVLESSRSAAATAELRHQLDGVGALLTRAGARPAQPVGGESPPPPTEPRPDEGAVPGTREGLPAPTEVAAILGTSSTGPESVPAALYSALAHDSFEGAVAFAIRCGGDTDTVGAMTGAIAGARHGASAIPDRWLRPLEDGERGRSYVTDLAERLLREREAVRR